MAGYSCRRLMTLLWSTQVESPTVYPFAWVSPKAPAIHCVLIARLRMAEIRLVKVNALLWQMKSGSHGNGPRVNAGIMRMG